MNGWVRRSASALLAVLSGSALAHPVDEVVQGAYLFLAPGEVRLQLELAPGAQVAGQVVGALDPNADGEVTDGEARAFAEGVLEQSTLTLDGTVAAWSLKSIDVPDLEMIRTGNTVLTIAATAIRPEEAVRRHELTYENRYEPTETLWMANIFVQPASDWRYVVTSQERSWDGSRLTVTFEVAEP